MFTILATVCLLDAPQTCAQRIVPNDQPCAEDSAEVVADWAAKRSLIVQDVTCPAPAETIPVTEIADGVFVHTGRHEIPSPDNNGDLANSGFVIGGESVAVIDPGGTDDVAIALLAAVRARTDLPIRYVVLTHMHPDHALGAAAIVDGQTRVVAHARYDAAMSSRFENYIDAMKRLIGPVEVAGTEPATVDLAVAAPVSIDLGGRRLALVPHPTAHTDNDLTIFDEETGVLWAGDLVFAEHTPAVDGSILGWIEVLETLMDHDASAVVPGHGPATLPWPAGGQATLDYLRRLADQTRTAISAGISLGEAAETVGQDLRGDWHLFDEYHPRNVTAVYTELEWE